ncbi:Urease accessory protein UreF [Beijerinckia indica subsp. indica ATCC 9039]|uniref:Urease accessory protein UreF n=2 Tax=Beijerinckia TaxID=532 RepID=B2ID55_BEII9|nr:Urease accessory protein UreF [Beijerinckia indica subsp. indica ATCC 9039]
MGDTQPSLLPLFVWLSPAFPVGGFAYSHGLEWAVETRAIHDAASLARWIEPWFKQGVLRNEAILLSLGWRAAMARDPHGFSALNALALALSSSQELHLETSQQGSAFIAAARAAWPFADLTLFDDCLEEEIAYPLALGLFAAGHKIAANVLIAAFVLAFCGNLVAAVQKLGIIGQADAQTLLAHWRGKAEALAIFAETAQEADLGTCSYFADIASMRHETQYSRLFRS